MSWWTKYRAARRGRAVAEAVRRGFDYAAGQLLRGIPMREIEAEGDCPFNTTEEQRAFDSGIRAAVSTWERLIQPAPWPPRKKPL